ncbi:YdcF family protein [Flavobacterium sp.]|uniref:YdcF family protein n=1 Tax=Flavobacterium sp. TaxID=239 RepID=UPI003B9BD7C6
MILLSSISILLVIAILGLVFHYKKKRKSSFFCFGFLAFYFFIVAVSPIPQLLIHSIEKPFYNSDIDFAKAKYILVLGAGYTDDAKLNDLQKLSSAGAARLTQAVLLKSKNPHLKLILSGKSKNQQYSVAEAMARAAIKFGIPSKDIIKFHQTKNTYEEALQYKSYFKDKEVIVVSSASHLKRANEIFTYLKVNHQVYAADFSVKESPDLSNYNFKPSSSKMELMDCYVHELLGTLYFRYFLKQS